MPAEMTSWQIVCNPAATESEPYAASEFSVPPRCMAGIDDVVGSDNDSDIALPRRGVDFVQPHAKTESRGKHKFK